ncbi:MAG: hypothetical protein ACC662_06815 [Planctomycetota bacterium]
MKDGEVLHGAILSDEKGVLRLDVGGSKPRRLRRIEVAEVLPGEPPLQVPPRGEAALPATDPAGRLALARFAWSRRLDADARRLAEAALAIEKDRPAAHALLGHVRDEAGAWVAGWPAPWPPAWRTGPRWGARRARAAGRGGVAGQRALVRALEWLRRHQDEDGRLDADGFALKHCPPEDRCDGVGGGHHGERTRSVFDGVTTALAVLAFSGAGSTPVSGGYAGPLRRGLSFCVATVREGGGGFDGIWNLAFATQAVADVCAAARDPALFDVVRTGVERLEGLQRPDGGWSYVYTVGDVPTTAAVLTALGLAAQAGVGVHREVVERALLFLDARVDVVSGRSEYHEGAETKGYTPTTANAAAALGARAAVGALAKTPLLGRQIRAISAKRPKWRYAVKEVKTRDGRKVKAQIGNLDLYAWTYTAFALAAQGGASWASWRGALEKALRQGQRTKGHAAGSWDPVGPYALSGGRAYVTGLGALMLEMPARYPWPR